jgi:hypothetical protein
MPKNILAALVLRCNRCRHAWLRRIAHEPRNCPNCKTIFWNQPRVRKIRRDRKAKIRG